MCWRSRGEGWKHRFGRSELYRDSADRELQHRRCPGHHPTQLLQQGRPVGEPQQSGSPRIWSVRRTSPLTLRRLHSAEPPSPISDLLSDRSRRRRCSRRGCFLRRGLLDGGFFHGRTFLRRLSGSLRRGLLDGDFLRGRCGLLCGCESSLGCFRQPPTFLGGGDDSLQSFCADPAFCFGSFRLGWRWRLSFAPDFCPSLPLRLGNGFSTGGAHPSSALACGRFRRGGGFGGGTNRQHRSEFGNLLV